MNKDCVGMVGLILIGIVLLSICVRKSSSGKRPPASTRHQGASRGAVCDGCGERFPVDDLVDVEFEDGDRGQLCKGCLAGATKI